MEKINENEYIYPMCGDYNKETGRCKTVMCRKTGFTFNHYGTEWIEYQDRNGKIYHGRA